MKISRDDYADLLAGMQARIKLLVENLKAAELGWEDEIGERFPFDTEPAIDGMEELSDQIRVAFMEHVNQITDTSERVQFVLAGVMRAMEKDPVGKAILTGLGSRSVDTEGFGEGS